MRENPELIESISNLWTVESILSEPVSDDWLFVTILEVLDKDDAIKSP